MLLNSIISVGLPRLVNLFKFEGFFYNMNFKCSEKCIYKDNIKFKIYLIIINIYNKYYFWYYLVHFKFKFNKLSSQVIFKFQHEIK